MKKIAIITMGVKLKGEKGYTRFGYLAEFLTKAGFQVDLITTSFQHWEKAQRDLQKIQEDIKAGEYPFGLRFIYEPGYKKNVDLARIRSHRIAAKNLQKMLEAKPEDGKDYDLLYAEIPPNDVARVAAEYGAAHNIPFVADVNDLWPEAMRMVLDVPVVSDILFHPLQRDAEKVYSLVSGVVGTSDEYRDRPFKNQKRNVPKITVYVGNEIEAFDKGAEENKELVPKREGEFWVSYAGTIGTSYDIRTMVLAGEELVRRGHPEIKIKILGGGPMKEELEEQESKKLADDQKLKAENSAETAKEDNRNVDTVTWEKVADSMIYDLYLRENLKSHPSFEMDQKPYEKVIWEYRRQEKISKTAHVEVFRDGRALLFDYENRDPLLHNAAVKEIQL